MRFLNLFKGKSSRLSTAKKYRVPPDMTPKEYAAALLSSVKGYADKVRSTDDILTFSYALKKLVEGAKELIWLNEVEGVAMRPTPRSELAQIRDSMDEMVDSFLTKALQSLPPSGCERANALDSFAERMQSDELLSKVMQESHLLRLEQCRQEAQQLREEDRLQKVGIEPYLDCSDIDGMAVIVALEQRLSVLYHQYSIEGMPPQRGLQLLNSFKHVCETSSFPLAAEVRLESLLTEYESKFSERNVLSIIDGMNGRDFELWAASFLQRLGFSDVEVTPSSRDQGVDVLAKKDGIKYAVQCKCYSSDLGNTSVQEVHAGKSMYHCQVGAVLTNRHFTSGGKALAEATGVLLWDRDWILHAWESGKL